MGPATIFRQVPSSVKGKIGKIGKSALRSLRSRTFIVVMLQQRKLTIGSPSRGSPSRGAPTRGGTSSSTKKARKAPVFGPSVAVRQQPVRASKAALLADLSLADQYHALTEYKKTVEKTAAGQLNVLDDRIKKVHQRIMLSKERGADIDLPQEPSPGRAPDSDMKHHGKKRSPEARARGQARNRRRLALSDSPAVDVS